MKTTTTAQFGITISRTSQTFGTTEPVPGRKPVLALPMRLLWAAALGLSVFGAQAEAVLTTLHSFGVYTNGVGPGGGLVQGSDGYFYGTTEDGGTHGYGTVFKISPNGALTTLYSFAGGTNGANPHACLVQSIDGYFYGTTYGPYGLSPSGYGTVFKISAAGALTNLYSFTGRTDGANPFTALVRGSDGYFYGTTQGGGAYTNQYGQGYGTVFKIGSNGVFTTLHSFTGGNDGAFPEATLVQGTDGNFYGTASYGGRNNVGTVFKISADGALTNLYSFTGESDGAYPQAGLTLGSDGNFYGTAYLGGDGAGTVFKISSNGAFKSLYSFTGANNGVEPETTMVQASDGNFYGTTEYGPGTDSGTVFKINSNGVFTTLCSLAGQSFGGLVQGRDGNFYGTTLQGGAGGAGTVYRLTVVPPPQLALIPSGPYMILTWPTNYGAFSYAGYTLQSTTNLGSSAVWTTVSPGAVTIDNQNIAIATISGPQQFYRLSVP
jgi:uncharacterized repeat protein (TIGR03803 family)